MKRLNWANLSYYAALVLSVLSATGWMAHRSFEASDLNRFCAHVPLGATIVQVREAAADEGFSSRMEPFVQMRITPTGLHAAPPSCRVFFNNNQVVEYRALQEG